MTTAEHVQRATGAPMAIEPLLRERNFGDLRGKPYAELAFDSFALDYAPPNGETWPAFHERVDRAWARVQELAASTTGGSLAVVTHGLVCRSLAARHLILADGDISPQETAWLEKFILADGKVDDQEKAFLLDLKKSAKKTCPEFEAMIRKHAV